MRALTGAILAAVLLGAPVELLPAGPAAMKDGAPAGWESRVGATTKGDRDAEVLPGPEGGVLLRGGAATGRWRLLARPFPVAAGETWRLSWEARAKGLRLEPGQFDNAWVGVAVPLPDGKRVDRRVVPAGGPGWTPEEMIVRAGAAGTAEAWIFLTKTGTLEVRGLAAEPLRPEDSFDALVRAMGRYYSHFASKGIDWPKAAAARRAAALAAKDEEGFVAAVVDLLSELKDVHVVVRRSDGRTVPTFTHAPIPNYDFAAVTQGLKDAVRVPRTALAGTVDGDLGYLAVFSLPQTEAEFAPVMAAFEGMIDRRGLLLDLRACSGGDERRAAALVGRLAKERVVYARTRVRSGPLPTALSPPADRVLEPAPGRRFAGPVVVLLGPGCVSSGEGMAQMLAALPGVLLMGQPTAGASGNPSPVDLPNGVSVGFSRWVDLLPDGTPLEGHGVVPEFVVEPTGPGDPTMHGDPTFEWGVAKLRERVDGAKK